MAQGMLTVELDPASKRDKRMSITAKGQRWRAIAAAQIRMIETDIAQVIGEDDREALRGGLTALIQHSD